MFRYKQVVPNGRFYIIIKIKVGSGGLVFSVSSETVYRFKIRMLLAGVLNNVK